MNRQIIKSPVWHGDSCLGDADVSPAKNNPQFQFPSNEIRIARFSPPSERCPPLSILHTISPFTILCKVQSLTATDQSPIYRLYLSCFHEQKTAIVVSGQIELHLVAMPTKVDRPPCFWCFSVPVGLYNSCMGMLNLRCLAIVFDLDETLIVANTLKSFEDRIEALSRRIDMENDPLRVSGMYAELRRYLEDKALLKQYADSDNVMDNGRLLGVQNEEVHAPSSSSEPIVRPVIRLQDKNIVLTRINPEIRDTSVLVRLRPAWEDLRSYLTAKGRKRFEVYVCTMAERDYALEMWRLLDPGSHLINSKQLSDRIVCVKSGSRKSLLNVFQSANCHPRMAMVIDDRMKVWDEKDQARVHVVPAFTPYHAPQAETANAVPVLCVARNVACNVRGGFFKEFDENVLRRVYELYFENDISNLPFTPDVSSFLITEDSVHSREASVHEGINGVEAERKDNGFENLDERKMQPQLLSTNSSLWDDEVSRIRGAHANKDTILSAISIAVLNEIGRRCESKVEFKPVQNSSKDSQTSVEVYFNGEKIGTGSGQTVKEAQHHAADTALRHLANSYVAYVTVNRGTVDGDLSGLSLSLQNENGFLSEHTDAADNSNGEELPKACSSASGGSTMPVADDNATRKKLPRSVVEIKEERVMCVREDLHLVFREQTQASVMVLNGEHCSQATKETLGASKAAESRSGQKQSGTSRA